MNKEKRHLVIGLGQIGTAIQKILQCDGVDVEGTNQQYNVIHVCFPYSESFEQTVKEYQAHTDASLTIVHSTVPVGTCSKVDAVHSPIRGIHPDLEESIHTFVKYFGGPRAQEAAQFFEDLDILTECFEKSEATEAGKLWSTTGYGINILLQKAVYQYCQKHGLDFDQVYGDFNRTYNEGFEELGRPEFRKYNLPIYEKGPIGGHCVVPNAHFLGDEFFAQLLIQENARL